MQDGKAAKEEVYVIALQGKLSGDREIEELKYHIRYLQDRNIKNVVLNLMHLDWMASVGIGVLISFLTTMRNAGGDVRLSDLNDKIKNIMAMTHLDQVFQIYDTADVAVQSFLMEKQQLQ
jgi:anti-sigma B factor antagonist